VAHELPAHGHYLAGEVGLLAGVSGDRIGQWARWGHIRSSRSEREPRVYRYEDVAEAMFVHELEELGAGLPSIRRAVERLRERQDVGWPLQHNRGRLGAANGTVVEFEGDEAYDLGARSPAEQGVLETPDLHRVAADLERGGWAARVLPDLRHIEVNPDRLGGRPVIRGRRIAAQEVALLATAPGGRETASVDYDLEDAQIDDAVRWWATARSFEAA
jgi:uncharacterized protein (DUF433 family)/DNA-binding transcriptional MerR regulator